MKIKNITKSESLTVRLSPRVKYGLELLARKQHRNLSSVVEWAVMEAIRNKQTGLLDKDNKLNLLDKLWHIEEMMRMELLKKHNPELLTFEEEVILRDFEVKKIP